MVNFNERHAIPELMDQPGCDKWELFRTLDELHVINEWLGGYAVSLQGIKTLLPKPVDAFHLLDVGCGGGELAKHLQRWAQHKNILLNYTGIDQNPHIIHYARFKNKELKNSEFLCEDLMNMNAENSSGIVHASL